MNHDEGGWGENDNVNVCENEAASTQSITADSSVNKYAAAEPLPRAFWLGFFEGFLSVVESTEKLLESEHTETGESCDCGEKASS